MYSLHYKFTLLRRKPWDVKDGYVGSNATSSHLAEMNSALTVELPNDRYASGELEDRPSGP